MPLFINAEPDQFAESDLARVLTARCGRVLVLAVSVLLTACATPNAHYRIELIDAQSQVYQGTLEANSRAITVGIGTRVYNGFYVQATESVTTTAYPSYGSWRSFGSMQTQGQVVSNQARAHLRSSDGDHLSCEFLIDNGRGVGSCQSPAGQKYQFVAAQ